MEKSTEGFMVFGGGSVSSNNEKIEICEKEKPEDYKIIKGWIDTL